MSCINRDLACSKQPNLYLQVGNPSVMFLMVPNTEVSGNETVSKKEGFANTQLKAAASSGAAAYATPESQGFETVYQGGYGMMAQSVGGTHQYSTFNCYGSWLPCDPLDGQQK